ncbi:MAG: CehA/McbA family metallohydrolase [Planctomycetales bacterium]|nr:CehA/McbA family metallohydrolase [Planctomycetales bacterium]
MVKFVRVAFCTWVIAFGPNTQAADTARLNVRIVDASGELTAARAWVEVQGKRFFQPLQPSTAVAYARDQSFSCDGEFGIEVPAGTLHVHIEKGKEYFPIDDVLVLESNHTTDHTVQLVRWIDLTESGWYSADLHVHFGQQDPKILRQLALADDVNLVPAFSYWLRGREESWRDNWPDASYLTPDIVDTKHVITRNNIEIERIQANAIPGGSVGATFLFNLKKPILVSEFGEYFPTDAALGKLAQSMSPQVVLDSDKPAWSETVVGAALGALDTIQICHNHYHRNATLNGGWGMIGPIAAGESNSAEGDGLFHRTNGLYYRLLNCGFHLGVSGGSAIGVMPVPTGFNRVYAQIDGPLTADKMWTAIRSGRSFATTGPVLMLSANGCLPGESISVRSANGQSISIDIDVQSIDLLEGLQLINNGNVISSLNLQTEKPNPIIHRNMHFDLAPNRSGWLAARVIYRAPDGMLRQAHTSPIYISVDDQPTAFADDAAYMLRWIAILEEIAKTQPARFPSAALQDRVLAVYDAARRVYQKVLSDSRQYWDD